MVKILNSAELNTEEEVLREDESGNDCRHAELSGIPMSVYQVHILSYLNLKQILRYRCLCRNLSLSVQGVIEYEIVCQKAKLREFEEEMMRDSQLGSLYSKFTQNLRREHLGAYLTMKQQLEALKFNGNETLQRTHLVNSTFLVRTSVSYPFISIIADLLHRLISIKEIPSENSLSDVNDSSFVPLAIPLNKTPSQDPFQTFQHDLYLSLTLDETLHLPPAFLSYYHEVLSPYLSDEGQDTTEASTDALAHHLTQLKSSCPNSSLYIAAFNFIRSLVEINQVVPELTRGYSSRRSEGTNNKYKD